jgi:thioredoxin-related protein
MQKHPDEFAIEQVDMDTQPEQTQELTKKYSIRQGPAFLIFRDSKEILRREGVADPLTLSGAVQDLAGDSAQNQPTGSAEDRQDAGRHALEQLDRQLEAADRQLDATKRQIEDLVRQKEAIVKQASEITKQLQQQSSGPQQP